MSELRPLAMSEDGERCAPRARSCARRATRCHAGFMKFYTPPVVTDETEAD
jgi:hypothetical protein